MERWNVLIVGAGSALGGMLRYLVWLGVRARGWTAFPWATLIVNLVGCFLITFVLAVAATVALRTELRLFLVTGVLGGLTTYSTFDYETTRLFQDGAPLVALANVGATLVGCFVAGLAGLALARIIAGG
jgi:fluoride exporter